MTEIRQSFNLAKANFTLLSRLRTHYLRPKKKINFSHAPCLKVLYCDWLSAIVEHKQMSLISYS
ncbi:hypothetical protein Lal_00023104 [Lupinus albus]|nr:hypothetical protein Lal_00023104 [Lupinus albus]